MVTPPFNDPLSSLRLADTFYTWYRRTNDLITKVNPIQVYGITTDTDGLSVTVNADGIATISSVLPYEVGGDHDFIGGITFSGTPITFNTDGTHQNIVYHGTATHTYHAGVGVSFSGSVTFELSCDVNFEAIAHFNNRVFFNDDTYFGALTTAFFHGDVVIGSDGNDSLLVNSGVTFNNPVRFTDSVTHIPDATATLTFAHINNIVTFSGSEVNFYNSSSIDCMADATFHDNDVDMASSSTLHLQGIVKDKNNAQGEEGKVLTSTSDGRVQWAEPTGGGGVGTEEIASKIVTMTPLNWITTDAQEFYPAYANDNPPSDFWDPAMSAGNIRNGHYSQDVTQNTKNVFTEFGVPEDATHIIIGSQMAVSKGAMQSLEYNMGTSANSSTSRVLCVVGAASGEDHVFVNNETIVPVSSDGNAHIWFNGGTNNHNCCGFHQAWIAGYIIPAGLGSAETAGSIFTIKNYHFDTDPNTPIGDYSGYTSDVGQLIGYAGTQVNQHNSVKVNTPEDIRTANAMLSVAGTIESSPLQRHKWEFWVDNNKDNLIPPQDNDGHPQSKIVFTGPDPTATPPASGGGSSSLDASKIHVFDKPKNWSDGEDFTYAENTYPGTPTITITFSSGCAQVQGPGYGEGTQGAVVLTNVRETFGLPDDATHLILDALVQNTGYQVYTPQRIFYRSNATASYGSGSHVLASQGMSNTHSPIVSNSSQTTVPISEYGAACVWLGADVGQNSCQDYSAYVSVVGYFTTATGETSISLEGIGNDNYESFDVDLPYIDVPQTGDVYLHCLAGVIDYIGDAGDTDIYQTCWGSSYTWYGGGVGGVAVGAGKSVNYGRTVVDAAVTPYFNVNPSGGVAVLVGEDEFANGGEFFYQASNKKPIWVSISMQPGGAINTAQEFEYTDQDGTTLKVGAFRKGGGDGHGYIQNVSFFMLPGTSFNIPTGIPSNWALNHCTVFEGDSFAGGLGAAEATQITMLDQLINFDTGLVIDTTDNNDMAAWTAPFTRSKNVFAAPYNIPEDATHINVTVKFKENNGARSLCSWPNSSATGTQLGIVTSSSDDNGMRNEWISKWLPVSEEGDITIGMLDTDESVSWLAVAISGYMRPANVAGGNAVVISGHITRHNPIDDVTGINQLHGRRMVLMALSPDYGARIFGVCEMDNWIQTNSGNNYARYYASQNASNIIQPHNYSDNSWEDSNVNLDIQLDIGGAGGPLSLLSTTGGMRTQIALFDRSKLIDDYQLNETGPVSADNKASGNSPQWNFCAEHPDAAGWDGYEHNWNDENLFRDLTPGFVEIETGGSRNMFGDDFIKSFKFEEIPAGKVIVIRTWNWYAGSNPSSTTMNLRNVSAEWSATKNG